MTPAAAAEALEARARALGFDACAAARIDAAPLPDRHLDAWIGVGHHADMDWIPRSRDVRADPRVRLPAAKSVVVVARNYYAPDPPLPEDGRTGSRGKVARYARGKDYHKVLKPRLAALAQWLDALEPGAASFHSVDAGPVLERTWAARAGLGWTGRNTLLLRRDLGSWFFLGAIVTTIEIAPGPPYPDACGSCRACLDACPTQAFPEPGVLDARRCISYHTIENKGEIPPALAPHFGGWVFGCDICQEVCPWNRFAQPTTEPAFAPRPHVAHPPLDALREIGREGFDRTFAGTPVRRAGPEPMRRNARLAADLDAVS